MNRKGYTKILQHDPLLIAEEVTAKTEEFFSDFQNFLRRSTAVDLGVGLLIGSIFGSLMDSFLIDILSPPIGLLTSGSMIENYFIVLKQGRTAGKIYVSPLDASNDGAITENIGRFVQKLIYFLLMCFILYVLIRAVSALIRRIEKNSVKTTETKLCTACDRTISFRAQRCCYCTTWLEPYHNTEPISNHLNSENNVEQGRGSRSRSVTFIDYAN